jgi:8-oxo-dGDP phosphatase
MAHAYDVESSEQVYDGAIIKVRRDQVTMPGGNSASRDVVVHPGAVGVVAYDGGRILLLHQYRHPVRQRLWELPAGLLDVGGEPPQLTAARELHEEAGLKADTWRVLVDLDSTPGFSDESVRVYLATGLTQVDRPEAHDEEADMTLQWYPLEAAVDMVLKGEVVNAIAVAGILAAHVVTTECMMTRPPDSPWTDKPTAFAARKAAQ